MLKSLYGKLALVLVALLLALGIGYALFSLYAGQLFLQEVNQRLNRDLARELLVQQNMGEGERLQAAQIKQLFSYYMHINPAIEIYLLDTEGRILAFEAPQMKIRREQVDVAPIRQFLAGDIAYPLLGDDPRSEERKKTFSAAAYPLRGEAQQYLYVVLGGEDYDHVKALLHESYFLRLSLSAVAATVIFGLLTGLYLFNLLTRRLDTLSRLMSAFRRSGFRQFHRYSGTKNGSRQDEIDALGESYNEMAERIIAQVQALEEKDTLRRHLIANVSHDLRTPLASLQGYLETLQLKGEELSPAQLQHYLDTAYQQSRRLTRLVNELFELSRLDAIESPPQREPVALGELVMDVVQKYRLQAQGREIALQTQLPATLPLVSADIAMLDRVLENLLGNALEHTPQGGHITLTLQATGQGVELAVCNSGEGIRAEDLPHLFERFYQAPERRRGKGAGLGLAIVRRILELHGSTITVDSATPPQTCFRFTLAAA